MLYILNTMKIYWTLLEDSTCSWKHCSLGPPIGPPIGLPSAPRPPYRPSPQPLAPMVPPVTYSFLWLSRILLTLKKERTHQTNNQKCNIHSRIYSLLGPLSTFTGPLPECAPWRQRGEAFSTSPNGGGLANLRLCLRFGSLKGKASLWRVRI